LVDGILETSQIYSEDETSLHRVITPWLCKLKITQIPNASLMGTYCVLDMIFYHKKKASGGKTSSKAILPSSTRKLRVT
jgi:hypothetical protein